MAKSIIFLESATKKKTIETFLGRDYIIFATGGHLMELAKKGYYNLGVDLEKFTPSYEIIPGKILRISVSDISRLYYTSSGSLLNIEESRSPVLVLKIIKGLSKSRVIKEGVANAKYTDSNPLYVPPDTRCVHSGEM